MSMFQCGKCGCAENTACTNFFEGKWTTRYKVPKEEMEYNELPLCCVCLPKQYKNGETVERAGKWHNQFSRYFLPMGEYHTNLEGCLEHTETGATNYQQHAIKVDPEITHDSRIF